MKTQQLVHNLEAVRHQITELEKKYHRNPNDVCLIAVSKTHGIEAVRSIAAQGQFHFGENYVQEAIDKITNITDMALVWHFIGPIQKNKTKLIASHFNWVHSIDRESVAIRLNKQRPTNLPVLNVCIQVNIDSEDSKSGVAPEEVLPLAQSIQSLTRLKLRGLMAIPSATSDFEKQLSAFQKMSDLLDVLVQEGLDVDTLSMGMSGDYEAAIASGATMLRIGTAIFGPRSDS